MKNKTIAAWLALLGGPLGLHRFYLYGLADVWGWALPIPTALGLYGLQRAQVYGLDDRLGWVLLPCLGLAVAVCALTAIVYGLTSLTQWNQRFNPQISSEHGAGRTNWLTVTAVVLALMVGAVALVSTLAFGAQRYFEYQKNDATLAN